jgi:hypothetical protein
MVDKRNDPTPEHDAHDTVARRRQWLKENAVAFAAQARWHERHDHPLADILMARPRPSFSPAPGARP